MPQQAVGIFIGAALPGGVRVGKIDGQFAPRLNRLEPRELTTIIKSQRPAPLVRNGVKGVNSRCGKGLCPLVRQFSRDQ